MRARRNSILFALAFVLLLIGTGCTVRYSQGMVGRIERLSERPIVNSDSGVEIGLVGPTAVIAFSEPIPAKELSSPICEYSLTEVDYRGTWYAFYIIGNFPEIKTTGYCVTEDR